MTWASRNLEGSYHTMYSSCMTGGVIDENAVEIISVRGSVHPYATCSWIQVTPSKALVIGKALAFAGLWGQAPRHGHTMRYAWRLMLPLASVLIVVILFVLVPGAEGFVHYLGSGNSGAIRPFLSFLGHGTTRLQPAQSRRFGGAPGLVRMMNAANAKGKGPYRVIANNK